MADDGKYRGILLGWAGDRVNSLGIAMEIVIIACAVGLVGFLVWNLLA